MKKVLMTIIAVLLVVPLVVSALSHTLTIPRESENDPNYSQVGPDTNGDYVKTFPVYVNQTGGTIALEEITIKFSEKETSDIKSMAFAGTDTYNYSVLSTSGKTRTVKFKVKSGKTAEDSEKILVGFVKVTVNQGSDCSFIGEIVNNPSTGAFMDYALIGGSVALIGAIYFATKSKKKMFNI